MEKILINNELTAEYPDGFHVMTEEEKNGMTVLEDGDWIGLSDPARHILITVGWKQVNILASMILNARDLAQATEKQVSSAMQAFGYKAGSFAQRQIAGHDACGFGYEYTAQGTDMYAESYVAKIGKSVYYFHFYARTALKSESVIVWKGILDRVRNG